MSPEVGMDPLKVEGRGEIPLHRILALRVTITCRTGAKPGRT